MKLIKVFAVEMLVNSDSNGFHRSALLHTGEHIYHSLVFLGDKFLQKKDLYQINFTLS